MMLPNKLCLTCVIVIILSGCAKNNSEEQKILAKVKNRPITVKMVSERIEKLPSSLQEAANEDRKKFLENMLIESILYEEAKKSRVGNRKDVKELVEAANRKIVISKYVELEVDDKIIVKEEEIENFYNSADSQFIVGEKRKMQHALVPTFEEAEIFLQKLNSGEKFYDLVKTYSVGPAKTNGGDIGYIGQGDLMPQIEEICFSLKKNEISDIIKTHLGYHIIKVIDILPAHKKPLNEVKNQVVQYIKAMKKQQIMLEFIKKLSKKYEVKIYEE